MAMFLREATIFLRLALISSLFLVTRGFSVPIMKTTLHNRGKPAATPATFRRGLSHSSLNSSLNFHNNNNDHDHDHDRWLGEKTHVDDTELEPMFQSFESRKWQIRSGIGKRYRCRTTQGFLNVHSCPGDPFDTSNVVGIIEDGHIITSTEPPEGDWIAHEAGWSIATHGGFVWLEELQD